MKPIASRREVLCSMAGLCAAGVLPRAGRADVSPDGGLKLLLEAFMDENLRGTPELATALGLDVGALSGLRFRLNDRSPQGRAAVAHRVASQLRRLKAYESHQLSAADTVHYRAMSELLTTRDEMARRFVFGEPGVGNPYSVSQMTGAYSSVPDFLDSKHPLERASDVDAYVERVRAFVIVLDQETTSIRKDARSGIAPPDFVLDRALGQMRKLRAIPARESTMIDSLRRRTAAMQAGQAVREAESLYEKRVLPALDRQIAQLAELRKAASSDAGVWRLPDGDAYYAACLQASATTTRTADDIHRTGLALVEELSAGIDTALRRQGLTHGTVAQRIRAIYTDAKFHFANTGPGKAALMDDTRRRLEALRAKLPQAFSRLPQAMAEVRAVPEYLEEGSPAAYYQDPSIDGSRPGVYYLNLRDTGEIPTWYLPTVSFHEVIPGHHLQQAIAQEGNLPLIRKVMWSQAYGEGWALYAEQLADELGMYEADSWGRIGYLWAAMFRACRLVADTGLHAKRWSREQTIQWMSASSGASVSMIATEVERYCIQPGQACSYMIGKLVWNELRVHARTQLGSRFDIRQFHDAGLRFGAVALPVLESLIGDYIRQAKNDSPTKS